MKRNTYTSTQAQRQAIEDQFARFAFALRNAEPRELPRSYGYEIETPTADTIRENVLEQLQAEGKTWREAHEEMSECLDFKQDGSVSGENQNEECECDCNSCLYHECDCEHCEGNGSSDPEHDCGSEYCYNSGEYQEITSIGGTTTTHPKSLDLLERADLEHAEINDTCGVHLHIGSADLTGEEVARVISAYRAISDIMTPIAERGHVYYCQANEDHDIERAKRGQGSDKYRAVNTAPHFSGYRPKTIEFRQHAGTNSVHAVRAWAVLLVHLVEYAKRNKPVFWLARCADFDELATELGLRA